MLKKIENKNLTNIIWGNFLRYLIQKDVFYDIQKKKKFTNNNIFITLQKLLHQYQFF